MASAVTWALVLTLQTLNDQTGESIETIEKQGFSTIEDCSKAAEAASEIFMMLEGKHSIIESKCKSSS